MKGKMLYKLFFLFLLLLDHQVGFAQFEEGKTTTMTVLPLLQGASLANTSPYPTNTYTFSSGGEDSKTIKNTISFRINENSTTYFASGFTAVINFTIVRKATLGGSPITTTGSLTVNYDKTAGAKYTPNSYLVLPASEQVTLTVNSITISGASGWNPIDVLQLDNNVTEIRYYTLQNFNPVFNTAVNNTDALHVSWSWPANTNNNTSQLEWAWVEDEMAPYYNDAGGTFSTDKLFNSSATRVSLDFVQNGYNIPLLYDGVGKLYYRVRPTLQKNNGSVITGSWSAAQNFAFIGHDSTLNWQSSTSYAENGKSKTVIQYFDGSLRSRQTVTKDNTTGNTLVAETIYDLQGRANVQILPTPTLSTTIQYFKNFNRFQNMALNDDPAKYFDLTPATGNLCAGAPMLDTTQGNGKYYSANNPWLGTEANAKYVPDAYGYAYTETRYMDDATQRVQTQGGVGSTHQVGNGHETKYYYGKPNQTELDAIFGTEVGDASHYSKSMVQDANGQLSVSYIDMHGRTVATALAGVAPAGMNDISTNTTDYPEATSVITNQLLTPLTNIVNGNTIENVNTILAATNTAYNFTYQLDPAILSKYSCTGQQICFDCKYDLEIAIRSEDCGGPVYTKKFSNLQIQSAGTACTTSMGFSGTNFDGTPLNNVKQIAFTQTLSTGSWVIRKTLTINDSLYQIRRDSALKVFLCKTQQNIYDSVYNVLYTTTGCGLPANNTSACDSCNNHLGTFANYRINYLVSIGSNSGDHTHDAYIQTQYSADSLACASACNSTVNVELSTLKNLRRQMLADMIPFTGQYAIPKDSMISTPGGPIDYYRLEAKYNIFSTQYQATTRTPFFHLPKTESGTTGDYLDDAGLVDNTIEPGGDRHVILDTITQYPFAGLFTPSWANSLIYYHPEFSKLQYAEQNLSSSYSWLDKVQAVDTYATAVTDGYTDPLNISGTNAANADPFFQISANAADRTTMINRLTVSFDGTNPGVGAPSIWQLANSSVLCAGANNSTVVLCSSYKTQLDPAITVDSLKDKVWAQVKSLYFSFRNELVLNYIDAHATGALSTADKNALIANNKQIVFANQLNFAVQNGLNGTTWVNLNNNPPDTTGTSGAGGGTIYNTDKCVAMRPFWMARLKQCEQLQALLNNETHNDSTRVNNIINKILDGMVSVCHNSLSAQQPDGASNVNPGYSGTPQNFEDVVNQVFADSSITIPPATNYFCNPYTIDYPKPYGLTTPLYPNNTNTIDSCGCKRFAALKLEAGPDSVNLTRMNTFLLANYQDTLSLPLWTGLQNCSSAYRDSCTTIYDTASYGTELTRRMAANALNSAIVTTNTLCPPPAISTVSVATNIITVNYTSSGYSTCTLYVTNASNTILYTQALTCSATSVNIRALGINPCTAYNLYITSSSSIKGGCATATSDTFHYYPSELCPHDGDCPARPAITRVSFALTSALDGTENIQVTYTIAAGGSGCLLNVYQLNSNGTTTSVLSQSISCVSGSTTVNLPACIKYLFVVQSDYSEIASCGVERSDTALFNSCKRTTCTRVFDPITLPNVVTVPPFLNCGYIKPCITCGKLDTLTMAFRALYTYCSGVPFTDSAATDDQLKQNGLWARYLNYKTGFSNTYYDYIQAYNACHAGGGVPPSTTALCRSTKPANDPGGLFITDTLPCKTVQNQATYLAVTLYQLQKDSLIANFDSLYHAKCLGAKYTEQFYVTYQPKEYHYTLYYYDQGDNLVKTIPPAAVKPNYNPVYLASVISARAAGTDIATNNNELMATQYRYNTLNQVVAQKTPDANTSKFWYDRLGRLVVSQNAKQNVDNNFSYTQYDQLGRITEVGQKPQSAASMAQTVSQDETALSAWLAGGGTKEQITRTVYDVAYTPLQVSTPGNPGFYQQNLRNRVSYTYLKNTDNTSDPDYVWNSAMLYSYDIHGNVDTLLQDYGSSQSVLSANAMNSAGSNPSGNRWKRIVYNYDLISGKVNSVAYQPNQPDAFYHRYNYDMENRLISAETSQDSVIWETDARYTYYRHGPLSRTILGQLSVQGMDYAYTLQGWQKGVNSTAVGDGSFDMGNDGVAGGANSGVARDAYGYSLNYFTNDYKPVNAGVMPFAGIGTGNNLFNGNVKSVVVNIPKLGDPLTYVYGYDQLNRLTAMDAYNGLSNTTNTFTAITIDDYKERITYDPNGNIRTYLRNGTGATTALNNYSYTYTTSTNRLASITNAVNTQTKTYAYDEIGNTTDDGMQGMTNAVWNVYGKLQSATNKYGANITYTYSADGQRISKKVGSTEEWYVKDAIGNTMATYKKDATINSGHVTATEFYKYGNSLVGIKNHMVDVEFIASSSDTTNFVRGEDGYILNDARNNTMTVVSDKKLQVQDPVNITQILYYLADIKTANFYSAYGAIAKTYGLIPVLAFNGQRKSTEIDSDAQTAEFWEYNGDIGRRANIDPITHIGISPYSCFNNNPIIFVDLNGADPIDRIKDYAAKNNIKDYRVTDKGNGNMIMSWFGNTKSGDFAAFSKKFKATTKEAVRNYIIESNFGSNSNPIIFRIIGYVKDIPYDFENGEAKDVKIRCFRDALYHSFKGIADNVNASGELLEKIKSDPAFIDFNNAFINSGQQSFTGLVCFGGKPLDESQFGKNTMKEVEKAVDAATHELTWVIRNTMVTASVMKNSQGAMYVQYSLKDGFSVQAQGDKGKVYNTIAEVFHKIYHEELGGNEKMTISANWTMPYKIIE